MHVVALANQKGGVGKTTTAVNLAGELARRNQRVLLIDCDPQGNATTSLGIPKRDLKATTYEVLMGLAGAKEVVRLSAEERKLVDARSDEAVSVVERGVGALSPKVLEVLNAARAQDRREDFGGRVVYQVAERVCGGHL